MTLTPSQKHDRRLARFVESFKRHGIGHNVNEVATIWQRLVRLRHADEFGMCRCVCTGKRIQAESTNLLDLGHFISRSRTSVIFHEWNCHPQRVSSNRFGKYDIWSYSAWMERNYSLDAIEDLRALARQNKTWTKPELAEKKAEFLDECRAELARIERGEPSRYQFVYPEAKP